MARHSEQLPLPVMSPGTRRTLLVHRYGATNARPKAYIQAALHADELPGLVVAQRLIERLDEAADAGQIKGQVVLVPYANPIGLAQRFGDLHQGRFDFASGSNFNRDFADVANDVVERLQGRLGPTPAGNVALIRTALTEAVAETPATSDVAWLRRTLLAQAIDADIVLDLHCDSESVMHLFLGEELWPGAADLAADLQAEAVLLANESGGVPFDEACSMPWWRLRQAFGDAVPAACLAVTVELRGAADVGGAWAGQDAKAIFRFLQRRGVVAGDPGPLPTPLCDATPLTGAEMIRAPVAGVVDFRAAPGAHIKAGQTVAEIVDPAATEPRQGRTPVVSQTDGVLYGRMARRLVRPGEAICKVAGATPRPERTGRLLED
jgi:predicted deacylase